LVSNTIKDIQKKYGNVVFDAAFLIDTPIDIIKTTPNLDVGLFGGVPSGSITLISGAPKCGKSSLILNIIRNAQKQFKKKSFYLDIESRLKPINLLGIDGLNTSADMFTIIRSTEDKILSGEEILDIATDLIKSEKDSIIVLDSSSAICSLKEQVDDITGQTRSLGPKLFASFCRKNSAYIKVNRITVLIVQHLMTNLSGYGSPFIEDGGERAKYFSELKIRATGVSKWMSGETQIGQITTWNIIYSGLGPPGAKVQTFLRFNYGLDLLWDKMVTAIDLGEIKKAGAWFEFCEQKFQGQDKLYSGLQDNEKLRLELDNRIFKDEKTKTEYRLLC
jgi:recombination protein RecA